MRYWAVRYSGAPEQVRTEKAETPERAFKLAFGVSPVMFGVNDGRTQYKDLGTRVEILRSDKRRIAALTSPDGWVAFPDRIRWSVGEVTRPDAGGPLYAPVRIVNNEFVEHGLTPSHSREVMEKAVAQLNKVQS